MADVAADLKTWSTTASSNSPSGATAIGTGLDDNLREIQKVVRQDLANVGADIVSASTTDLGAVAGLKHKITGTTTITSFGTVSAGIWKLLHFAGALTLTHNSTSLILPSGANITTAAGDTALFLSEGSGNWRCIFFQPARGQMATLAGTETLTNKTINGASFDRVLVTDTTGPANGLYLTTTNQPAISANSTLIQSWNKSTGDDAGSVLAQWNSTAGFTHKFCAVSNGGWNGANTAFQLGKDGTTNRSLNAAGTLNASGADLAEAKYKRGDCGVVPAGAVCGLDDQGKITDRWDLMVQPRFKSGYNGIEPALVMGDSWGAPEAICPLDGKPLGKPEGESDESWKTRFNAARQQIDRLVYCGTAYIRQEDQVGADVVAAGDYIVAAEKDGGIGWKPVKPADLFSGDAFHLRIGRVERIDAGIPLVDCTRG